MSFKRKTEVDKTLLLFPCEHCGARKGVWCTTQRAQRTKWLHATRFTKAHAVGALPLPMRGGEERKIGNITLVAADRPEGT